MKKMEENVSEMILTTLSPKRLTIAFVEGNLDWLPDLCIQNNTKPTS